MATALAPSTAGTRYQPIRGRWPIVWAFLDALVLAKRSVLETMRQPLEEGRVTISRAAGTMTFPSQFMLVAAMDVKSTTV